MGEVVVAEFGAGGESEIAAAMLRAAEVPFRFRTDDIGGMVPGMQMANPTQLLVADDDAELAKSLLGTLALEAPRPVSAVRPDAKLVLILVGVAFFLIALGVIAARGA